MLSKQIVQRAAATGIALMCAMSPAWADEEPMTREEKILNDYNNDYNCGQVIPMEAVEPADYLAEDSLQSLYLGKEALPLMLGDSMDLGGGTLVYQPQGEAWQARIIRMGTSITQVYTNAERNAYWIFFMHTAEAPGPIEYLYLTETSAVCGELAAPEDINQPEWNMEYSDIKAFNIDAEGKGTVQASALLSEEEQTPQEHWYLYHTENNGETWTKALLTGKPDTAPGGVWERVEAGEPDATILRELLAH